MKKLLFLFFAVIAMIVFCACDNILIQDNQTSNPCEVLGHDYIDATCTVAKICNTCGATAGGALGHDWKEAKRSEPKTCNRCGITTEPYGRLTNLPPVGEYTDRREGQLKIRRDMLNDRGKELYDQFLPYVLSYTPFTIDCNDMDYDFDTLWNALNAIRLDYPEAWLYFDDESNFDLALWNNDMELEDCMISLSGRYHDLGEFLEETEKFDKERMSNYIAKIDDKCEEILEKMPKGLSTKEKYLWLANYICATTEYDDGSKYSYADGPLLYGKGICQSYSYAYQWLCQKAGLWNVTCSGMSGSIGHCWNVIMLDDGQTYYMDLTWQDNQQDSENFFMTYEECTIDRTVIEGEWIANGKK